MTKALTTAAYSFQEQAFLLKSVNVVESLACFNKFSAAILQSEQKSICAAFHCNFINVIYVTEIHSIVTKPFIKVIQLSRQIKDISYQCTCPYNSTTLSCN